MNKINHIIKNKDVINLADTFESIRYEKRLSKSEFAELCGISASFYSEIIHNKKSVNLDTLQDICIRLDIPIYILLMKALNEQGLENPDDQKLVRELKPIVDKMINEIYGKTESNSPT